MKLLKIRQEVIGTKGSYFGIRNSIEQWFSELKRMIRQFNVCFPNEASLYKSLTRKTRTLALG